MRHFGIEAGCGLLVLALACSCSEGKDESGLSTGQVKLASKEGQEPGGEAAVNPASAQGATGTPGGVGGQGEEKARPGETARPAQEPVVSCSIHSLALEDVSSEPVVDQAEVHKLLTQRFEPHFGSVGNSGNGLTVKVEYLIYRRESEGDSLYLGARALISKPVKEGSVSWEANASAEEPTPASCKEKLAAPGCSAFVLQKLMPSALDQLVVRTYAACALESAPVEQVRRSLGSADAWERAQAAKASGERGLKELSADLVGRLKDENEMVAVAVVGALGRLEAGDAVDALVARAQGASSPLVAAVAVALVDIGTSRARSYVEEWAKNHPLSEIRERCTQLLSATPKQP